MKRNVAKGPSRSLLSWKMSQRLKLIRVATTVEGTTIPELLHKFFEVTTGMGEYKGEPVKIHIVESIKPVAQPHRRIPFHVRKQVEEKLDQLQKDNIIERAEGPTPWVSPIVVVPKPHTANETRICVHMRSLNKAIIRERHIMPTTDDIIADLNGCKVFSKIDLNQGYHQLPLHPDSRHLTTFSTHVVISLQTAELWFVMRSVRNISDDIYIGGIDEAQHDDRLIKVLQRLKEN